MRGQLDLLYKIEAADKSIAWHCIGTSLDIVADI